MLYRFYKTNIIICVLLNKHSAVLCMFVPLSFIADKSEDDEASHEIWHSHSDAVEDLNFWDIMLPNCASSFWCFKGL
jgi:hypothetical protein